LRGGPGRPVLLAWALQRGIPLFPARGGDQHDLRRATRTRGGAALKALFIGNSFTARNDLPGLVARLAEGRGKGLDYCLLSAGGASLRTHWNAGEARQAIREGQYDAVVLQEQSTLPVKNAKRMYENVRLFDEAIKAVGAKTVLYMTWARQDAPDSQRAIAEAYTSIGRELGATVGRRAIRHRPPGRRARQLQPWVSRRGVEYVLRQAGQRAAVRRVVQAGRLRPDAGGGPRAPRPYTSLAGPRAARLPAACSGGM
jgi:hypothetical protein